MTVHAKNLGGHGPLATPMVDSEFVPHKTGWFIVMSTDLCPTQLPSLPCADADDSCCKLKIICVVLLIFRIRL